MTANNKSICECSFYIIILHIIIISFNGEFSIVECVPSAQQESELLLLDALGRKQVNNHNAIASSYEPNSIMDMLGRSKLIQKVVDSKIPITKIFQENDVSENFVCLKIRLNSKIV